MLRTSTVGDKKQKHKLTASFVLPLQSLPCIVPSITTDVRGWQKSAWEMWTLGSKILGVSLLQFKRDLYPEDFLLYSEGVQTHFLRGPCRDPSLDYDSGFRFNWTPYQAPRILSAPRIEGAVCQRSARRDSRKFISLNELRIDIMDLLGLPSRWKVNWTLGRRLIPQKGILHIKCGTVYKLGGNGKIFSYSLNEFSFK